MRDKGILSLTIRFHSWWYASRARARFLPASAARLSAPLHLGENSQGSGQSACANSQSAGGFPHSSMIVSSGAIADSASAEASISEQDLYACCSANWFTAAPVRDVMMPSEDALHPFGCRKSGALKSLSGGLAARSRF